MLTDNSHLIKKRRSDIISLKLFFCSLHILAQIDRKLLLIIEQDFKVMDCCSIVCNIVRQL